VTCSMRRFNALYDCKLHYGSGHEDASARWREHANIKNARDSWSAAAMLVRTHAQSFFRHNFIAKRSNCAGQSAPFGVIF
jgi:hypothetical protein